MSFKTCPTCGYVTLAQTCPPCRNTLPKPVKRNKPKPVQLSPEKRIKARIVAERLLAMARNSTSEIIRAMGQRQP
jgi:hypothetical protein